MAREAVISSCRASAWEMALALRDDMQQNGIDPDIAGSSALLMECQHRGLPQLDLLTALPALQEGVMQQGGEFPVSYEARERDLERLLIQSQAALAEVRQLLAKLEQRDRKIVDLTSKLEAHSLGRGAQDPDASAVQAAKAKVTSVQPKSRTVDLAQAALALKAGFHLSKRKAEVAAGRPERAQALALLGLQLQEKQKCSAELAAKVKALEEQLDEQRLQILQLLSPSASPKVSDREGGKKLPPPLKAFLEAAGPKEPDFVLARPALLSAFTESLELNDVALEDVAPEERLQMLSLFLAWAVVGHGVVHFCDLEFSEEEVKALEQTLVAAGEVKEWEMTRCRGHEEIFKALAPQPLRRLNLGYNALGLQGISVLLKAAESRAWSSSLSSLGLEMNGLGDKGCAKIVESLQLLPSLSILELGWNELTEASAKVLLPLVPQLRRLGLGGNSLKQGGISLALQALAEPSRELELDLSMNHISSSAVWEMVRLLALPKEECELRVTVNLEWNVVDDPEAVRALARALACSGLAADVAGQPLFQLANNELEGLEPSEVLDESKNLIML
ncbi:unnamed protein product [Effrenium voratum]|nr:unnamed protein product [Effrenium voratum]